MAFSRALHRRRHASNLIGLGLASAATAFGLVWLVWILGTTLYYGLTAIDLKLFTQMTPPPGESGGLLNAIAGSALMIVFGVAFGTPIGVMAGTWLAEYAHGRVIA